MQLMGRRSVATGWPALLAVLALALLWASPARAEKQPVVSLRYAGGPEVEVHIDKVGIMATFIPKRVTEQVSVGSVVVCEATYDTTYYALRYFIKGPQDSWYLGAAAYKNKLASGTPCGVTDLPESGALPMVGYQWLWDSGFNIDLGLRPGILALGFSF